MTDTHYILCAGQTQGPWTLDQIKEMTHSGQIPAQEALYLDQEANLWKPLHELLDAAGKQLPGPVIQAPEVGSETLPAAGQKSLFYENYAKYLRYQKLSSPAARKADPRFNPSFSISEYAIYALLSIVAFGAGGPGVGMVMSSSALRLFRTPPAAVQTRLDTELAPMARYPIDILYRFYLGCLEITASIEADNLSGTEIVDLSYELDDCLIKMNYYTPKTGNIGCILACIFFDPAKAAHFRDNVQLYCTASHTSNDVFLRAQAIDVQQKTVRTRSRSINPNSFQFLNKLRDRKAVKMLFPATAVR